MQSQFSRLFIVWLILVLFPRFFSPTLAQEYRPIQLPAVPGLRQLARSSAYIFAGTVTSIQPVASARADEVATVRLTFHVDQGIRGVRSGQSLTIREWSGLWQSGERYRVGERVLLFLYPPSKLGLTSPVGGPLGRMALDSKGQVLLDREQMAALAGDPAVGVRLRNKSRVSSRDFAHVIRREEEE